MVIRTRRSFRRSSRRARSYDARTACEHLGIDVPDESVSLEYVMYLPELQYHSRNGPPSDAAATDD